jgi:hypothetical protein
MDRSRCVWLGSVALLCYATHGTFHCLRGTPESLIWMCQLGTLMVGVGLLLRSPVVNAVGVLWLSAGTPFWIIGVSLGSTFLQTSVLTHLGGLSIGLWGAYELGIPRGAWWKATGLGGMLHLLSRWGHLPGGRKRSAPGAPRAGTLTLARSLALV